MRTPVDQPARLQMWIAVIAIFLLAGSALVAIVRVMAMSYESVAGKGTVSRQGAAPDGSVGTPTTDPQSFSEAAQTSSSRRSQATCRECGVIESIVRIERHGDIREAERAHVKNGGADAGRASAGGASYDVTVRFRDGSTIVLNEATLRSWRAGSRVIAIAGAGTSIE